MLHTFSDSLVGGKVDGTGNRRGKHGTHGVRIAAIHRPHLQRVASDGFDVPDDLLAAVSEVVDDDRRKSGFVQRDRRVGSDEAGAPGHEDPGPCGSLGHAEISVTFCEAVA